MLDQSLRFSDPARWQAALEGVWLLKTYSYEQGCLKSTTAEDVDDLLILLESSFEADIYNGDLTTYYYRLYDPEGNYRDFSRHASVKVTLDELE